MCGLRDDVVCGLREDVVSGRKITVVSEKQRTGGHYRINYSSIVIAVNVFFYT